MTPAERLEALMATVDKKGLPGLSASEVPELARLYRIAAARLARLRSRKTPSLELERLNTLVAKAYTIIYTAQPQPPMRVSSVLLQEFPAMVRKHWHLLAISIGAFVLGAIMGAALTMANPQMPDVLLGPGSGHELHHLAERHVGVQNWMPDESRPLESSMIITNNIRVSVLAFASGILLGLGSVYLMWFNGIMLGACGAVVGEAGVAANFWAFVAPHGVLELTAIFISGAAGLLLASAVIMPGDYTRADALRLASRDAMPMMAGVVAMLLMAGTFEAFLDPAPEIPNTVKFTLATVLFMLMTSFFVYCGRQKPGHQALPSAFRQ